MAKNVGGIKRDAHYVPRAFRGDLRELSKSDLMDLLWDVVQVSVVGEDAGEVAAYEAIRDRCRILNNTQDTGTCAAVKRMRHGAELARMAGHREAVE